MEEIYLYLIANKTQAVVKHLDNEEFLVVPVIALREGVHNQIFYSKEEIKHFANTWNGVPVTVNHPEMNGQEFLSANNPYIEEHQAIGRLYNVTVTEDGALKGEAWINKNKTIRLGHKNLLSRLMAGDMVEVSTGLYMLVDMADGEYQNKKFKMIGKSFRPDHLAILPDSIGACSINDGCGAMRTNTNDFLRSFENMFENMNKPNTHSAVVIPPVEVNNQAEQKTDSKIAATATAVSNEDEKATANAVEDKKAVDNNEVSLCKLNALKEFISKSPMNINESEKKELLKLDTELLKKLVPISTVVNNNILSDSDLEYFRVLKAEHQKSVDDMVTKIVANYSGITTDMARSMKLDVLKTLVANIKVDHSFLGVNGADPVPAAAPRKRLSVLSEPVIKTKGE